MRSRRAEQVGQRRGQGARAAQAAQRRAPGARRKLLNDEIKARGASCPAARSERAAEVDLRRDQGARSGTGSRPARSPIVPRGVANLDREVQTVPSAPKAALVAARDVGRCEDFKDHVYIQTIPFEWETGAIGGGTERARIGLWHQDSGPERQA